MDHSFLSHSPSSPIVFKNTKYDSASEALQAYICDYEGNQNHYKRRSKYDKQLTELLCRKNYSSSNKTKDSKSNIRKLVQSAFEKLKKDEKESVQRSLSASMQLMQRIENDRLPSPPRLASACPSRESCDTDILLDAKPITPISNYHVDLNDPKDQKGAPKSSQSSYQVKHGNPDYQLLDEANRSFSSHSGHHSSLRHTGQGQYGNRNQSVYHANQLSDFPQDVRQRERKDRSQLSSSSYLNKSLDSATWRHPDLLSGSQLGRIKSKVCETVPVGVNESNYKSSSRHVYSALSGESQFAASLRTPEKQANNASRSMNDIHSSFQDINSTLRSFNSSIEQKNMREKRHDNGRVASPSRVKELALDSDATSSSIVAGHMYKGTHERGLNKMASTPKKHINSDPVNTRQSRFDMESTKSSTAAAMDLNDITEIPRNYSQHTSKNRHRSPLLGKPPSGRLTSPDGRRDIIGILKGYSPGKTQKPMSRVSFTTDDLLNSNPHGVDDPGNGRPRSTSLPRPLFTSPPEDTGPRTALPYSWESNSPHSKRVSFDEQMNYSFSNNASKKGEYRSGVSSPQRGRIDSSAVAAAKPREGQSVNDSLQQSKYRQFLNSLMKEIDEGGSSVATSAALDEQGHSHLSDGAVGNAEQGCGFLSRIQNLLASERIPTVSQYLDEEERQEEGRQEEDSVATDAVLDGDRPWEQRPSFKPPIEVRDFDGEKPKAMFERFMDDCMQEAQGSQSAVVPSTSQTGSLEALKNMLFTVQGLSTSQDEDSSTKPDPQYEARLLGDAEESEPTLSLDDSISKLLSPETRKLLSTSYSKQPGGPALHKAMEHLTKLKGLVENKDEP